MYIVDTTSIHQDFFKMGEKKQKLTSEHDACNEKSLKQLITHC